MLRAISLDVETYGSCERDHNGLPLPSQKETKTNGRFSLPRARYLDRPTSTVLTTAITPVEFTSCPGHVPSASPTKSSLSPSGPPIPTSLSGDATIATLLSRSLPTATPAPRSYISLMHLTHHRRHLLKWLHYSNVIMGMNLGFDIPWLRGLGPSFRRALDGRHLLVDLSILNYLHNEQRPEKSQKDIGTLLGTHAYQRTLKQGRFKDPLDPQLHYYNCEDTTYCILDIAEFARRITTDFPSSDKLSPYCLTFYSDTLWSTIYMSENGVPIHRPSLETLAHESRTVVRTSERYLRRRHGLHVSKASMGGRTGSQASRNNFSSRVLRAIQDTTGVDLLASPRLGVSEKQRWVQFNQENRRLFRDHLPPGHPLHRPLGVLEARGRASKLLTDYCYPYLWHRSNHPTDRSSTLVPQPGAPQWRSVSSSPSPPQTTTTGSSIGKTSDPSSTTQGPSTSSSPTKMAPLRSGRSPGRPPATSRTSSRNYDVWLSHPTWYPCPQEAEGASDSGGTLQGRITCKKGKHQTDPKEIQRCYRSRWYTGSILKADLSQIELRVAALLSGEPSMLKPYSLDANIYLGDPRSDLHTVRTQQIYGDDIVNHPNFKSGYQGEDPRQVGKMVNFADLFRAGWEKMQHSVYDQLGLWKDESFYRAIVRARPHDRPLLWKWQTELIAAARRDGRIELPFTGQSRYFEGGTKFDENEIVNMPVQTTAGNVLLRIQAYFVGKTRSNPNILPFLNVYDAIVTDCRNQEARDEALAILEEAVRYVCHHDLWALLQERLGRECPIVLEAA